jgi:hypothetical protein
MIRMVYFDHQEYRDFPHVGSIVAAVAAIPWDDNDPEEVERAHKAARTNREAHVWAFLHPPSPSEVSHMANPPAVAEADEETTAQYYPSPSRTQFLH